MIQFRDVTFSYGSGSFIDRLSFNLERGRYLVISGDARSGKTTIVQLIAGMLLPESGEIYIDGEDTRDSVKSTRRIRQLRRKIGGVGGIYSLLSDCTILENVSLAAEIAGVAPRVAHKHALEACAKYNLGHVKNQYPDAVSQLEICAALLARADAARKNLIIADSPTDGLDDKSAAFIHERLAAMRLAGATILYLTTRQGPQAGPDAYLRLAAGRLVS